MVQQAFGRRAAPDVNDKKYPMRMLLRPTTIPKSRYYPSGVQLPLNQGNTGTCVAHAWTGFMSAAPLMVKPLPSPFALYKKIVLLDEWDDNDHEATAPIDQLQFGTSVRAGVKHLQTAGHIKSYLWALNADDAALWLLTGKGSIVLGTNWYWDMGDTDGVKPVSLTGGLAGGHAFLCLGYSRVTKQFRCVNSWGREYGHVGRFWIRHADMERLIARESGEACAAVEQLVAPAIL